jgi:P pilus assembly chaperone PapD
MKISGLFNRRTIIAIALLGTLISPLSHSADSLQIVPTRVVLDNIRASELTLVNKGDSNGKYRIFLQNMRTNDIGKFQIAETALENEKFADSMIRYSPRQITITPNSFQKLRLMVRKPKSLEHGEYRTHMVFQTIPPTKINDLDEEKKDLKISITPLVQISIPVIIRHGKTHATASLSNVILHDDNTLSFDLNREGNRSLYGDLQAFIKNKNGKEKQIGYVKGLAVYHPNPLRRSSISVDLPDNLNRSDYELIVRFKEDEAYGGDQSATLSQALH